VAIVAVLFNVVAAIVNDIPRIYGPIATFNPKKQDVTPFLESRPSNLVHPSMWHSKEGFDSIRVNVKGGKEPWASAFLEYSSDVCSASNYTMKGPQIITSRDIVSKYSISADERSDWQNTPSMFTVDLFKHRSRL